MSVVLARPAVISQRRKTLAGLIKAAGYGSGLKICLDPSETDSYPVGGDLIQDTSGNGYNFYRGTSASGDGAEPTFSGNIGARTTAEKFTLDGGDFFTLAQANPTWIENVHKRAQPVTALWMGRIVCPTSGQDLALCGTRGAAAAGRTGFAIQLNSYSTSVLQFQLRCNTNNTTMFNQSVVSVPNVTAANLATTGTLVFVLMSAFNDVGGTMGYNMVSRVDGSINSQQSTTTPWTTTSSLAASFPLQVCARGDGAPGSGALKAGSQFFGFALFDQFYSGTDLDAMRSLIPTYFGL